MRSRSSRAKKKKKRTLTSTESKRDFGDCGWSARRRKWALEKLGEKKPDHANSWEEKRDKVDREKKKKRNKKSKRKKDGDGQYGTSYSELSTGGPAVETAPIETVIKEKKDRKRRVMRFQAV